MNIVRTTCPYCGVGCGVLAERTAEQVIIAGDPKHPANRGALCSKGSALDETLGLDGRLLRPQLQGVESSWESALDVVAQGFKQTIERHGPDAVAFYVSGQLLTEDYYVANKLMKGYIGSANIDTNSRLCMSSAVAAHKRAFGEDIVPVSYEDIDLANLVILVGSNLAWCHPVLYQRLVRAKKQRPAMRVVILDPRRTASCDIADLHLPLKSGTDVWLFNGLLAWLAAQGALDVAYMSAHTQGAADAVAAATRGAGDLITVAGTCGVAVEDLKLFFDWFRQTPRTLSIFSQGVNQSSCGTDKANAIMNVHLATGRIGLAGSGPFSVTGQPNAMGGREVGGLATTLAAHMDIENPAHRAIVQGFWKSPRIADRPGLKAVDLFEAVLDGRIKALWIMATNPLVSLPNANRARRALERCELVVVSDVVANTDTLKHAQVRLPALAWGEKDGTVTNSDRHISRQRAFLPVPGEARPDWWMICQVAARLGHGEAFRFDSAADIFDEHARLSAASNHGTRLFDIESLAGLSAGEYQALEPFRWPRPCGARADPTRLFGDGRFMHANGKARLIALEARRPRFETDDEYPDILNTGRIRDQWHTMTRTGRSARLSGHLPEPFVDMHALDAIAFGVRVGGLARLVSRWGHLVARVRTSGEMARGSVFAPIHWNASNASDAQTGALVSPSADPLSGEPEFKHTPVRVEPFMVTWYGYVMTRGGALDAQSLSWWVRVEAGNHRRFEIAGRAVPRDWGQWARSALNVGKDADWADYADTATGTYRAAHYRDNRLEALVYISAQPELPSRTWAAIWFEKTRIGARHRHGILSGHAMGVVDSDTLVCSCFRVGSRAIESAITAGLNDVEALGVKLKAGTNCGSCMPEIRRLLDIAQRTAE